LSKSKPCVFCGQSAVQKTKEHVIPRWLIEMTGDSNRQISLGYSFSDFLNDNEVKEKQISFNSFTFPACKNCNERFGNLEVKAKPIVEKLINDNPLSAFDFDILLDWFDKVRIGLWLGYFLYLEKNIWKIDPHFYISSRIGQADRALLIYKSAQEYEGVRFAGVKTPAFIHSPSCFTLSINNYFLTNVSHQYLLAKNTGFPYLSEIEMMEDEKIHGKLHSGTDIVEIPMFDFKYDPNCSVIGQVIFTQTIDLLQPVDINNTKFVQDHLLEGNRTHPLLQKGDVLSWYSLDPSDSWKPNQEHNLGGLITRNTIQMLKIQNYLLQRFPISKNVPQEKSASIQKRFSGYVEANNTIISALLKDMWET